MISVIMAAAGDGKRYGAGQNKAFLDLGGRPVLTYSVEIFLEVFAKLAVAGEIVIVVRQGEIAAAQEFLAGTLPESGTIKIKFVEGGSERQYSIANGLQAVDENSGIVLVHDVARPLVTAQIISSVIEAAKKYGAAIAAVPVKNTIKRAGTDGFVAETLRRQELWAVQTPQGFQTSIIKAAYEKAAADDWLGTDDASLVERLGQKVKIVAGDYENLKITTPEDMTTAEGILKARSKS